MIKMQKIRQNDKANKPGGEFNVDGKDKMFISEYLQTAEAT